MKARLLLYPISRGRPNQGISPWMSFYATVWVVSIHLERVSLKTNKYLYPPLPSWLDLSESVFPEFTGYWSLVQTSSWVRLLCSGLTWAQTWCLTKTSHTRLSSLGIKCVGLSNSEFCGPKMKVSYQSPASCFWKNDGFLWCPPSTYQPMGLIFPFLLYHRLSCRTRPGFIIRISIGPTGPWAIYLAARSVNWQWRTAVCRGSQMASMSIKFFFLCF